MKHVIGCCDDPAVDMEITIENEQIVILTTVCEGCEINISVSFDKETLFDLLGSLHYFQKRIK